MQYQHLVLGSIHQELQVQEGQTQITILTLQKSLFQEQNW